MGTFHLFALLGVGSGVWIDEEWPEFMDEPWKADSVNDLWGKRYHQVSPAPSTVSESHVPSLRKWILTMKMLRDIFILWSRPFESLPKPLYILTIFLASALFHIIIYYPMTKQLIISPYLIFYLSQGIGCILERAFYKVTGRKVGGWWGRVWMWVWVMGTGSGMVEEYYRIGWVGMMRGTLVLNGLSPAEGLGRWLGISPDLAIGK